ncbi:hypothetical protein P9E76_01650 [Schinkia azotoformans]|uniref:Uncharacterized protein n=1 Tax=Schinkia azotoformans LMG 9581 TaxID=1131731 RepID=K6E3Q1_SCHAZ|nr:hypothetical protein [Schinkia azotoformans]EKN67856.1 hypothetical protein BAZO_08239 [Schinkia azotoformans LMG 9581]MEC1637379.1 hypothetical protein [Schinkia azotoformans]MEC1943783.1 hypothetical protein [Schinkia azotoformans]
MSNIELIELSKELYAINKRMDEGILKAYSLAKKKAAAEREYRKELAKEMLRLREEKYPVSIIHDIARGNLADLKFERDVAEDLFKTAITALNTLQTEASVLQSIKKHHEVI